jgi:hypothetical protein
MKRLVNMVAVVFSLAVTQGVPPQDQAAEYNADAPKTIVELQQFRVATSVQISAGGGRRGLATLIDLNPQIGAWYLLKVAWSGSPEISYHLENPKPETQKLILNDKGIVIATAKGRHSCDLFGAGALLEARSSQLIYYPLCEGRIYLRNPATGHRTTLEAATEFLRDHVWGGEKIIDFGHVLMEDLNRETGRLETGAQTRGKSGPGLPAAAAIDPNYCDQLLSSANLGIAASGTEKNGMLPGAWYPVAANQGVYVSLIQTNLVDAAILRSHTNLVNPLDATEASALVYLVAFDLERFDLGFALGTEYPGVGWSDRAPAQARNPKLPGPDGIGSIAPVTSTGLINPENAARTVTTFTGGFKRTHGAFKYGELSTRNHGSHYGFIESGVVFSKLQPGLATIFALTDGSVQMKTWEEADNKLLARIRYARQNGVPLVELDPASRSIVPGSLVARWGPGNWSGSQDSKLRTIRSGAAIQTNQGKRFLIYAVFSDATPSAMARVFQAYQCDYAMLLDMNALEHTYCALYRRSGSRLIVDHLIKGMSQLDKESSNGAKVPRFLAYPDNRDFFFVMRRNVREVKP